MPGERLHASLNVTEAYIHKKKREGGAQLFTMNHYSKTRKASERPVCDYVLYFTPTIRGELVPYDARR